MAESDEQFQGAGMKDVITNISGFDYRQDFASRSWEDVDSVIRQAQVLEKMKSKFALALLLNRLVRVEFHIKALHIPQLDSAYLLQS